MIRETAIRELIANVRGMMTFVFLRRLLVAASLAAATLPSLGLAQAPGSPSGPPTIVSTETKAARLKLDAYKADLDQKEAALNGRDLSDADLQGMRHQIDAVAESIRVIIADLAPRLEAARARLEQIGPKPKEGAPEESPDVARERTEREAAVAEFDETQRLGRTLLVQAEQLITGIGDRRRAAFARALFERNSGILSPDLWVRVVEALPRDVQATRILFEDWVVRINRNASFGVLLLVGLAFGLAVALYAGRRHVAPRLVTRDPSLIDPPRRSRLLAALGVLLLGAVPAALGSFVVYAALDAVNIMPGRTQPIVGTFLGGLAFVAFARALADAILAPGNSPWRLLPLSDAAAARTNNFVVALAGVLVAGKVLEAFNHAIAAALPITVATRGIFALAAALILAELLRRFATTATQDEACLGPYVPTEPEFGGWVRIVGWAAVAAVAIGVLVGYVAFASFLVDQLVWISSLVALLLLAVVLADEFIGGTLRGQTRIATTLQANTGLRRRSLEQIGVLANGVARLVLIIIALMLALAPWGVESADVVSSLRAAFFGFKVGDVTISLSAIIVASLIFALGFGATRVVQRWLDTTYLPATDLDAGLRNSIRTAFGYFGVVVAGAIAFSYLGLSLDRLTIVAGALSVGIGFGLQSIVNNFVSGLILLWERPIRVGDLVVVGEGEGYVRRINVRATEIETFDRATIIVPNSSLISGVVRNRVRSGRMGRVVVSVPVPRHTDPDRVAELIKSCAMAHREVMSQPAPNVVFKRIGESTLDFDLVCFVDEIETAGRVSSELHFAIFRCLRDAAIIQPAAPAPITVQGLDRVSKTLDDIATAVVRDESSPGLDKEPPARVIPAPSPAKNPPVRRVKNEQ